MNLHNGPNLLFSIYDMDYLPVNDFLVSSLGKEIMVIYFSISVSRFLGCYRMPVVISDEEMKSKAMNLLSIE